MARTDTPSEIELRAMAEHIAYDVWMLHETGHLLGQCQSLRLARPWQSAILESLLVHTRNLVHFLYPPQVHDLRDGDIVATDYPSSQALPARPDVQIVGTPASELSNNISRRVAHIHVDRVDPGMQWAYAAVANVLVSRSLRYLASVENPFGGDFRAEFKKLGWDLDEVVDSLPADEAHVPTDLRAMRPNES